MKIITTLLSLAAFATPGLSQINLETAATYAVLAVKGITSTGTSHVTGNIGTTGQSITGFPPGIVDGTSGAGTAAITQAHTDAAAALTTAQGLTGASRLSSLMGGQVLTAGVYSLERAASLSGVLTLSGNGTFVFQIPSSLITIASSEVVLTDGAEASDVFWAVGSTGSLGASSTFVGNLMTEGLITVGADAIVDGGLFSGSSIALDGNEVGLTS